MNFPLISEYIEAIKAAEDNLDELKHLRPVLGEDGEPVMTSGNFAVVFKMKDEQTGKLHAVKCFLKEQEGRAEAYRLIAEELEFVSSTFLTPIKYLDRELFVDTNNSDETEFPVLLMDWVEGVTLDKYIRMHIDDEYELSLLAYQFSRLAMWLMPQPFAHGDLKPDNILVREDGTLVLVDYDGMYVPAMKGQKARELGSPDFRHPARTENDFDEHIDDFSLASILLSLKATSLQPKLLEKYGASDRLLFSEKDYHNLSESSALGALQQLMQDTELVSLYSLYILALSQNNLSQVSFRLFNLSRPDRSQYEEENLSTEVTEEDLANSWTDEYGVKYSRDGKRLLKVPKGIIEYNIKSQTVVICDSAFQECDIQSITTPDSLKTIGLGAFARCKSLNEVYLSHNLQSIGICAFAGCENLQSLLIPESVYQLGYGAFKGCKQLLSITIPTKIVRIEQGLFDNCISLSNIIIRGAIREIGFGAFENCTHLCTFNIPTTVETIENHAFSKCRSLIKIVIPKNVCNIGKAILSGCTRLTSLVVDPCNNYYDSRNDCNAIIDTRNDKLISGCSSTSIPMSVKEIGDLAFFGCENLKSIIIPEGVKSIGDAAFVGCSLSSISIPDSVAYIASSAFKNSYTLRRIIVKKGSTNKFEKQLSLDTAYLLQERNINHH